MIEVYYEPSETVWFVKDERECALVVKLGGSISGSVLLNGTIQLLINVENAYEPNFNGSVVPGESIILEVPITQVRFNDGDPESAYFEQGFFGGVFYLSKLLSRYCRVQDPFTRSMIVDDPIVEGKENIRPPYYTVRWFRPTIKVLDEDRLQVEQLLMGHRFARLASRESVSDSFDQKVYSVFGKENYLSQNQQAYIVTHVDQASSSVSVTYQLNLSNGSSPFLQKTYYAEGGGSLYSYLPFFIPVGFPQIDYKSVAGRNTVISIEVLVDGELLMKLITKDFKVEWERTYHWFSSLGGWDWVTTTGKRVDVKRKRKRLVASQFRSFNDSPQKHGFLGEVSGKQRMYKQFLGFKDRLTYERALDLLDSDMVFVDIPGKGVFPIVVTDEETGLPADKEHLYSFSFEYFIAYYDYGLQSL